MVNCFLMIIFLTNCIPTSIFLSFIIVTHSTLCFMFSSLSGHHYHPLFWRLCNQVIPTIISVFPDPTYPQKLSTNLRLTCHHNTWARASCVATPVTLDNNCGHRVRWLSIVAFVFSPSYIFFLWCYFSSQKYGFMFK